MLVSVHSNQKEAVVILRIIFIGKYYEKGYDAHQKVAFCY